MKFKFESSFVGLGSPKTALEVEVDQLCDVLAYFEQFLRGCGYHINGTLDVVPYEDDDTPCRPEVDMDGRC